MNIMFFITGLGMGGAERQVVDLADRMSARGIMSLLLI
ncbi:Poly(glycerol-phosphate) alpha-glucosyltransferase [Pseudomonas sp. R2-37-08W]|nr:Poly(glycerol-phosphate) alpha-glucosyltransferase [Pseudomonas sp. R2-37-08W]